MKRNLTLVTELSQMDIESGKTCQYTIAQNSVSVCDIGSIRGIDQATGSSFGDSCESQEQSIYARKKFSCLHYTHRMRGSAVPNRSVVFLIYQSRLCCSGVATETVPRLCPTEGSGRCRAICPAELGIHPLKSESLPELHFEPKAEEARCDSTIYWEGFRASVVGTFSDNYWSLAQGKPPVIPSKQITVR